MLVSGAAFSFGHIYGNGDADALNAQIEREIKGAKVLRSPKDIPAMLDKAWQFYAGFGDSVENANRAALYKQNLDKGKSKLYSAFQARDLMDFSAHGSWPLIRFLVDTVPFLGSRIVGLDKGYRAGIKTTGNIITQMMTGKNKSVTDQQAAQRFSIVVGAMTAATIALYLHNKDDEEFKKLEDWQRDMYWYFRIGDHQFFIPKPFELGAITTIAERALEQLLDDTKDGKLFAERMGHIFLDTFAFNPTPQIVKPLVDIYSNKNSFTGRQIESQSMARLSKTHRSRPNTTELGKGISHALDSTLGKLNKNLIVSPVQADYLIQQYFGWIGTMGAATADVIAKTAQGKEMPYKKWHEYQPIRRFYKDSSNPSYTRYGTEFYNHLREVGQIYADIRYLSKIGETGEAASLVVANEQKLKAKVMLNKAQKKLRAISTRIKLIQASKVMASKGKRNRIDVLKIQKNYIQEQIIRKLDTLK